MSLPFSDCRATSFLLISFLSYQTKALIQKVRTKIRETINQESSNKNLFYQLRSITYEVFRVGQINPICKQRHLNHQILAERLSADWKCTIKNLKPFGFPAFNQRPAYCQSNTLTTKHSNHKIFTETMKAKLSLCGLVYPLASLTLFR